MKNNIQLQNSYEKQRKIFEESKMLRAERIQKQIDDLELKISTAQATKSELLRTKQRILEEPFQDFESYKARARQASEQAAKTAET